MRRARRAWGSPTLPLLTLVAAGLGVFLLWTSGPAAPGVIDVAARPNDDPEAPFVFDPEVIEVTAGSTVRWVNGSQTFHTVTFSRSSGVRVADGTFEESMFEQGARIERGFPVVGQFRFFCQPHAAFMAGRVVVVDAPVRSSRRFAGIALLAASSVLIGARLRLGLRGEVG